MMDALLIEKMVYDLCVKANTELPNSVLSKISKAWDLETNQDAKCALSLILKNAKLAKDNKMPLCQDTGQVVVFLKGKNFPPDINAIVNRAVEKAYDENYFRKSIVKNALFERVNTKTNTPCVIHIEIADIPEVEIDVLIKGGGCENASFLQMLSPTADEQEIIDFVVDSIKKTGAKACPPYFLGLGIGGTADYAAILSKKALILDENCDEQHNNLAQKIQSAVNELKIGAAGYGGTSTCLDVKIITDFTHIACMPVSLSVNCHSARHATNRAVREEQIIIPEINCSLSDVVKVDSCDVEKIKSLKVNQNILLSGTIYTARDAAHKKLVEMIKNGEELPFELKNSIIFYAGPCPCESPCVTGSIGPTTAARMDKFTKIMYENGVLATIGKGERSKEIESVIKHNGGVYFSAIGGIACYLAGKFVKSEVIAFEDLGAEAVYKLEVKDMPLRVGFA